MTSSGIRAGRRIAPMLLLLLSLIAAVAETAERSPVVAVNAVNGLALKGYDPVAYFMTGKATPGSDAYTHRFNGATYRFASSENRDRFAAVPETYVPQYGGYCAYSMAIDRIADIDPERWAIVDGKLYLNNNRFVHALWSVNRNGNIVSADRNWVAFPKISDAQ
jgi:YHS domain-containing protein